jgi:decaprenylphospho-beta-D-erythro-pentofuranosid-2-ulose 2-reductase
MKRVMIIGATSAIAAACAREWAAKHAELFLVGRDVGRLTQVADDLMTRGASVITTWGMDVNDVMAHRAMLDACAESMGQIDIALLAHGTLPDQDACERDPQAALAEFSTNATSTIALLIRLATIMEHQRHGTIAVITSVAGDRGRPSNYVYGSAKAAVSTFCEGLGARLHRSGVHLVDIRPGFVATPMTSGLSLPKAMVASPESVARRIVAGIDRRAGVLYVPAYWRWIMMMIRMIPRPLFRRLKL